MHRETDRQRTITLDRRAAASDDKAQAGRLELSRGKLILGGLGFILLTVGIFWHQFHQIQAGDERPGWDQLRWGYLLLILLCLPIETVCAALRIWLLCRVLHPGVRLWTCVKAELSNVSVSMLTPSQTGGGPAQIYMLSREGVRVGTSLTISLISFMGTMVVLVLMGLYSLLVSGIGAIAPLFLTAFGIVILIIFALVFAALRPAFLQLMLGTISRVIARTRRRQSSLHDWWPPGDQRRDPPVDRMGRFACRLADIVYIYRDDASRFLRKGKASFAWVCLLSTAFLFSRTLMPYLCLRFLGLETSTLRQIVELQMKLIFLVFFAPTPGSAGLAEGASMALMSEMVPAGFVPYYNLLWRFSTAYLAALAGLSCLIHAVTRDLRKSVRQPRKAEPGDAREQSWKPATNGSKPRKDGNRPMKPSDYIIHLTISIFLIVGVYQFYFWCQRHYLIEPKRLNLPLDDRIPYWPSWVWIYSFLYYPLILYTNLIVQSPGHFTHLAISYLLLLGLQMPFFLLFPVATPEGWRRCNGQRSYSERFLAFVQGFDASSNSFPSMHTSVATLTAMHLYPSLGVASWSFPVLIGLSCLFTKQHYLIDLPAGAALGWLVFYIFRMTG